MNYQTARYVVIYHPQFMNELERRAWAHATATDKAEMAHLNLPLLELPRHLRNRRSALFWRN